MRAEEAITKTLEVFGEDNKGFAPAQAWSYLNDFYEQARYSMSIYLYELNREDEVNPKALYENKHDMAYAGLLAFRYLACLLNSLCSEQELDEAYQLVCEAEEKYSKNKLRQQYAQELTADILRKLFGMSEDEDD